jgi:hypothetical protein
VFRLAGLSSIAGAVLRVIAAAPSLPLTAQAAESLYLAIYALLLIGLLGIFSDADRLRRAIGAAGFVVAIAGLLLIRTGPRVGSLGEFQAAAAVLALGLAVVGAAALRERGLLRWMGAMWVASFVAGLAGAVMHVAAAFLVAVLLFCAGFVIAGVRLLRGPHVPQ